MAACLPVLYTIPNFVSAGSGHAVLNVIERLDRERFEPRVAVLKAGGAIPSELERLGVPVVERPFVVPIRPYATLLSRARRAAREIPEGRGAVWHSYHYGSDYSEPIVARLAGAKAWVYTKKNMNWTDRAWRVRSTLATRIAAQNTDMLATFFNRRWLRGRAVLVPPGVDLEHHRPHVHSEGVAASAGDPVVCCVAQLLSIKAQDILIEAVSRLPRVRLRLAGTTLDDGYRKRLEQLVEEHAIAQRVTFCGSVADVSPLLDSTDVFVLPSRLPGEGCPIALLEAMAHGLACITTDVPGCRDVIRHGVDGLVVSPDDPIALADAISDLLESTTLRAALGAAARRRVEAEYSIDDEVSRLQTLYASSASGSRR